MDNLIRTDTVFGKRANIVGNISADLVLESLGKVYIKSRNKALTLEELILSLVVEDPNVSTSRVKVIEGIENLDTSDFKEGTFVFDKLSNILYLFIDDELLELINVAPEGTGYVKRTGDSMTGRLAIYVKNGPPLYVNSTTLVENLNAQYLNGETAESFTRRNKDENINGRWTFRRPITFESNSLFLKDIIINGSIGSLNFASGFGGYGWRMDADTNTLTVDNLVVRKLMQVYELVVNKISATNGSLWVSNAGKVTKVEKLEIKELEFFNNSLDYKNFCLGLKKGEHFIKVPVTITNLTFNNLTDAFSNASGDNPQVKECWAESVLKAACIIGTVKSGNESLFTDNFSDVESRNYHTYSLFSKDFKFNCIFPIVTRNNYKRYNDDKVLAENTNSTLPIVSNYVSLIYSYYKYFANGDYYLVSFDDDSLPVFKPGDILRCLKWTYGGIKYYDAVVCNYLESKYVILLAPSFYDLKTTITYDSSLDAKVTYLEDSANLDLYKSDSNYKEPSDSNLNVDEFGNQTTLSYKDQLKKNLEGLVEEKDSLVLMGHLWDAQRQNAVYITSTDNGAPYLDVISGVNRPDFSVIYYVPIYRTIKLNTTASIDRTLFTGYDGLIDIPYTGNYYVLPNAESAEYLLFEYNSKQYLSTNKSLPQVLGESPKLLHYLNSVPNNSTILGESFEFFNILSERGEALVTEDDKYIVQESQNSLLQIASTRTTKARLGNLDGIQDEIFPIEKQPYGYGLYALNVFLTGEFYLNNGKSLAEIGTDAILFALASSNALYDSVLILREDREKAEELLKLSVYTRGELRSAGMRIGNDSLGNPGIVIWGNKILMATTADEFNGKDFPSLLLANGKIQGKFLLVQEAHSLFRFYNSGNNDIYDINGTSSLLNYTVTLDGNTQSFVGSNQLFRYRYINSLGEKLNNVYYIRRFDSTSNDLTYSIWLYCDLKGKPELTQNGDIQYVLYKNYSWNYLTSLEYNLGENKNLIKAYTNFIDSLVGEEFNLWSLEYDGTGNLGGDSLVWDTKGNVTISGTLYSSRGTIGGFDILNDRLLANTLLNREFNISWVNNNTYNIGNGLELYLTEQRECEIKSGSSFYPGNYKLSTLKPSIYLQQDMARLVLYSYLDTRGVPYGCILDGNTMTGIIKDSNRAGLSGDYLTFDTGENNPSTFMNLSRNGATWVLSHIPMGATMTLMNLFWVPIECAPTRISIASILNWAAYARLSGGKALGNGVTEMFNSLSLYWNSEGMGLIVFNRITGGSDASNWLMNAFQSGRLMINICGVRHGIKTELSLRDVLTTYQEGNGAFPPYDTWHKDETYPSMYSDTAVKATITGFFIPKNSETKTKINKEHFNYRMDIYNTSNEAQTYLTLNNSYSSGETTIENISCAALGFTTADDNSINAGGIWLLIMYNGYDDLYLPYFSGNESEYNIDPNLSTETATERINKENTISTLNTLRNRKNVVNDYYTGYKNDSEGLNRISVIINDTPINTINSNLLTEVETSLNALENTIANAYSWHTIPDSVITAINNTTEKIEALENEKDNIVTYSAFYREYRERYDNNAENTSNEYIAFGTALDEFILSISTANSDMKTKYTNMIDAWNTFNNATNN